MVPGIDDESSLYGDIESEKREVGDFSARKTGIAHALASDSGTRSNLNWLGTFVLLGVNADMNFVENVARLKRHRVAFRHFQETRSPVRSGCRFDCARLVPTRLAGTCDGNVAELRLAGVPGGLVPAQRASAARDKVDGTERAHFSRTRDQLRSLRHSPVRNAEIVWGSRRGHDHLKCAGSRGPIEPIAPGPRLQPTLHRCRASVFANSQLDPSERVRNLRVTFGSTPEGIGMPMFWHA